MSCLDDAHEHCRIGTYHSRREPVEGCPQPESSYRERAYTPEQLRALANPSPATATVDPLDSDELSPAVVAGDPNAEASA